MAQSDPVKGPARRIYLYWILLLVPTLIVGAGALLLLQREQGRLAARAGQVDEARRAALSARAQLAAESLELIVGDVESGVLDTLAEPSESLLETFLPELEKGNPLVRNAFLCAENGRLLLPAEGAAGEAARGFRRRFAALLQRDPPWSPASLQAKAKEEQVRQESQKKQEENVDRLSYAENVQRARRDVQALSKNRLQTSSSGPAPAPMLASTERKDTEGFGRVDVQRKSLEAKSGVSASAAAPAMKAVVADAPVLDRKAAPDRRGWTPLVVEKRLCLIGWVLPGGTGPVRGVELETSALLSRLGAALPSDLASGEGLCLKDEKGLVLHQAGFVDHSAKPILRVPVKSSLLPGWVVEAYLESGSYSGSGGSGFMLLSSLLVGCFVAAILAGGSLLLWQARRSELDSLQKTSFVANVSHELKTPLTTIRLYAELLEQGRVQDEEKRRGYLVTIGRETERLARLVNNVLDFSRLERGRRTMKVEAFDLAEEVRRLAAMLAPRAAEAGLRLDPVIPGTPMTVCLDRDALGQIVLNLADNAFKYAATGGELGLVLEPGAPGTCVLRLLDRGPGVPEALRERVFDKFYRIDESLTAERGGAGLGLSIARQLARAMGGELRCLAREGGGAEFRLELPAKC
jgi:hypothetical protein